MKLCSLEPEKRLDEALQTIPEDEMLDDGPIELESEEGAPPKEPKAEEKPEEQ